MFQPQFAGLTVWRKGKQRSKQNYKTLLTTPEQVWGNSNINC